MITYQELYNELDKKTGHEKKGSLSLHPMAEWGFQQEYLDQLDSPEWKTRLLGLDTIWDKNTESVRKHLREYLQYLKVKLKDWKETNVKVLQAVYR